MSEFSARSTCDDVVARCDLTGQNILVTGANSGIGFETARALASRGARVVAACRDATKANDTAQRIRAAHPDATVLPLPLDLGSFASIRNAANSLELPVLHTMICNAGLFAGSYAETADGIESTVGVCHFGHFLLFASLRDKLLRAGNARVVMVASESHRFPATLQLARFPLDASRYRALIAYGQAKLCNVLFANELTRRYGEHGMLANSLHPGSMIGTQIFRSSFGAKLLAAAVRPFTKSIPQGAATTVYCAVAPELAGIGGRYFVDCREKPMSQGARDTAVAAQLWEHSEARIGLAA